MHRVGSGFSNPDWEMVGLDDGPVDIQEQADEPVDIKQAVELETTNTESVTNQVEEPPPPNIPTPSSPSCMERCTGFFHLLFAEKH